MGMMADIYRVLEGLGANTYDTFNDLESEGAKAIRDYIASQGGIDSDIIATAKLHPVEQAARLVFPNERMSSGGLSYKEEKALESAAKNMEGKFQNEPVRATATGTRIPIPTEPPPPPLYQRVGDTYVNKPPIAYQQETPIYQRVGESYINTPPAPISRQMNAEAIRIQGTPSVPPSQLAMGKVGRLGTAAALIAPIISALAGTKMTSETESTPLPADQDTTDEALLSSLGYKIPEKNKGEQEILKEIEDTKRLTKEANRVLNAEDTSKPMNYPTEEEARAKIKYRLGENSPPIPLEKGEKVSDIVDTVQAGAGKPVRIVTDENGNMKMVSIEPPQPAKQGEKLTDEQRLRQQMEMFSNVAKDIVERQTGVTVGAHDPLEEARKNTDRYFAGKYYTLPMYNQAFQHFYADAKHRHDQALNIYNNLIGKFQADVKEDKRFKELQETHKQNFEKTKQEAERKENLELTQTDKWYMSMLNNLERTKNTALSKEIDEGAKQDIINDYNEKVADLRRQYEGIYARFGKTPDYAANPLEEKKVNPRIEHIQKALAGKTTPESIANAKRILKKYGYTDAEIKKAESIPATQAIMTEAQLRAELSKPKYQHWKPEVKEQYIYQAKQQGKIQ